MKLRRKFMKICYILYVQLNVRKYILYYIVILYVINVGFTEGW